MKIYNQFKKIKELNEELNDLKRDNSALMLRIESAEKGRKTHQCGVWCNGCKNLIETNWKNSIGLQCKERFCMLDNPCKDKETKNE